MVESLGNIPRVMVVMPWGRVGSNLLMSYLNAMKAPKTANESFNKLRERDEQLAWLKKFYCSPVANPNCEIISSKQSMLAIADVNAIEQFVLDYDVKIVRMFRRDPVRTVISQIRAKQYADKTKAETGSAQWAVKKGAEPLGASEIDIKALAHRLQVIEDQNVRLEAAFLASNPFDVVYEDFRTQIRKTWNELSRYLGLRIVPFRPPFRKATPDDLESVITNFDEVKSLITDRGFPPESLAADVSDGPSEFAQADPLFDLLEEKRKQLKDVNKTIREHSQTSDGTNTALEDARRQAKNLRADIAETERKLLEMC